MEDYTYHLDPKGAKVLGAHMLEVCPTIARGKPTLEVHPLGIGGKADPARLVFTAAPGPAVCAAVIDLGNRFRLVANAVDVVDPDEPLPKLPVARALWVPRPDLKVAAAAWIHAGSSHHTAFSLAIGPEHLRDFADMAGVEFVLIDEHDAPRRDPEGAALERGLLRDGEGNPGLAVGPRSTPIGLDYGTNSVRAVVVDCADGRSLGTHVFDYPSGAQGILLDARDPHLARQNPADYVEGIRAR